jgi:hypothetical protein
MTVLFFVSTDDTILKVSHAEAIVRPDGPEKPALRPRPSQPPAKPEKAIHGSQSAKSGND